MKNGLRCIISLLFPKKWKSYFLNLLGFNIHKSARIGFSLLFVDNLVMEKNSQIKNFNVLKGPFNIYLKKNAVIGRRNKIIRGRKGVSYGLANLTLGINAIIVSDHHLDLTRSISIGDNSIVAGIRSQLWTHGYVHASTGPTRFRVDGEINIGNNVYIGSGVLINPGVRIADTIYIGGNSTISKDLIIPGMYVNQPLRLLDKSYETIKISLKKVEVEGLVEDVYEK